MGFLGGAMKAGVAAKVLNIARREASKPQNQQKAKELLGKIGNRGKSGRSKPRR